MRNFLVLWVASILSIGLVWCGKSGQDMSFNDAYNKLFSTSALEQYMQKLDTEDVISEKTKTSINASMDDGFLLTGNIITDSIYDVQSGNAEITFGFDGGAYLSNLSSSFSMRLSGKVQTIGEKLYAYIDAFDLTPNTTNQEIKTSVAFISPLVNTLAKQWIDLSPKSNSGLQMIDWLSLSPYGANIKQFLSAIQHAIKTYPLLQEAGKTEIDGKLAYQIAWNQAGVSGFVTEILQSTKNIGQNIEISQNEIDDAIQGVLKTQLSGYIIVYTEKEIVLRIDSLQSEDMGILRATAYTKDGATFSLNDIDGVVLFTGEAKPQGKNILIKAHIPENNIQLEMTVPKDGTTIDAKIIWSWFAIDIKTQAEVWGVSTYSPTPIETSKPIQDIINWVMWLLGMWGDATEVGMMNSWTWEGSLSGENSLPWENTHTLKEPLILPPNPYLTN